MTTPKSIARCGVTPQRRINQSVTLEELVLSSLTTADAGVTSRLPAIGDYLLRDLLTTFFRASISYLASSGE